MLICLQVSLEHKTHAHSVTSSLCHVDRSPDCASKLELVGFDRDNLDERHLFDEFFRPLVVQAILIGVPSCTFDVHTLDVSTLVDSLGDGSRVSLIEHNGVKSRLIQSPSLASTGSLHKRGQVRLRNVET